jgi:hypothetical protein
MPNHDEILSELQKHYRSGSFFLMTKSVVRYFLSCTPGRQDHEGI